MRDLSTTITIDSKLIYGHIVLVCSTIDFYISIAKLEISRSRGMIADIRVAEEQRGRGEICRERRKTTQYHDIEYGSTLLEIRWR
jgi:hypothetical protein